MWRGTPEDGKRCWLHGEPRNKDGETVRRVPVSRYPDRTGLRNDENEQDGSIVRIIARILDYKIVTNFSHYRFLVKVLT